MPILPQVSPITQPASTQLNFRQMVGEILQWNPDLNVQMAARAIQNTYRRLVDERNWYGLLVKGQVVSPAAVTGGTITVTNGSTSIVGSGTAFTANMIGRQFRVGFSNPIYTIVTPPPGNPIMSPTNLSIDLPWGGQTASGVSYMVFQNIFSFGSNIKRLLAVVNQRQGYRLKLNIPQEVLNLYDTWRTSTGWTFMVANYAPSPDGQPQFELYPAPTFQQSFPFLAYTQPPDLKKDGDFPYVGIRSDVIVMGTIPFALLFRGKNSKYYDPGTADRMMKMYQFEVQKMYRKDDDLYPKELSWDFSRYPFSQYGADFLQSHDIETSGL
jgi:hypothetical protein